MESNILQGLPLVRNQLVKNEWHYYTPPLPLLATISITYNNEIIYVNI